MRETLRRGVVALAVASSHTQVALLLLGVFVEMYLTLRHSRQLKVRCGTRLVAVRSSLDSDSYSLICIGYSPVVSVCFTSEGGRVFTV